MNRLLLLFLSILLSFSAYAQFVQDDNPLSPENRKKSAFENDSIETTDVPEGIYAWTIDERFGDIRPTVYDTIPHRFQNENATEGLTGRYNTTGNLGSPRISRWFSEQGANMQTNPFIFRLPYDFFVKGPDQLLYTNTKSPFTNLTYHSCGNKTNGEDHLRALFAVNAGKRWGLGFKADYIYGRGYYQNQNTAHFDGTLYASYRGLRYRMHTQFQHVFLKNRENGGIEHDDYVNRPESFPQPYATADMPVLLARAYNKIGGNRFFFNHRYSLGFRRYRDAKGNIIKTDDLPEGLGVALSDSVSNSEKRFNVQTENATNADSLNRQPLQAKNQPRIPRGVDNEDGQAEENDSARIFEEYVPVTSFIHTFSFHDDTRRFLSNEGNTPESPGYFADFFLPGSQANDFTERVAVENTLAFELHEGFNKWMKSGLRIYAKHELSSFRFKLPADFTNRPRTRYNENYLTLGAQLLKQNGRIFRYNVYGELRTTGKDWGEFNVAGDARLVVPLKRDSLTLDVDGFVRNERPSFYYRRYFGRNAWWENDGLDKMFHARVQATLRYKKTAVKASLENIQNYTYFAETLRPYSLETGQTAFRHSVGVQQASKNTQLLAVTLFQDFRWGIFNWENELTYQATTNSALPVPTFTGYTNVYLLFRIAKVLKTELGADLRYFTKYYAPAYSPLIGQFAVQDPNYRVRVGNYPVINVYANFHLKRTRFYVMASHVNHSSGTGNPFLVPHYPMNRLTFRLGLSWNFIN